MSVQAKFHFSKKIGGKICFLLSLYCDNKKQIVILRLIMGITKSQQFSTGQNQLALVCKVLGHPARIAILEYLFRVDACICGDIVEEIGLAQSTISQHLKELKRADLIKGETEGAKVCYCLNRDKMSEIGSMLSCFINSGDSFKCC
jgi:ArsR family transcriptional regulator